MKTSVFLLLVFLTSFCLAEPVQDTVDMKDLWHKKDTSSSHISLKKQLPENQEIQLREVSPVSREKDRIRIFSQENETLRPENTENFHEEIRIFGKNKFKHTNSCQNHRNFDGHWCGFYFGFVNFAHTDYSDYAPEDKDFMELNYVNSFVMQFNIFHQSINLVPRNNFGIVVGLGMEYQRLCFDNKKYSIQLNDDKMVVPRPLDPTWRVKRNSFKTLYLTVPLLLEVQFPALRSKKLYVSAGVVGGLRLHSKTKIIYKNDCGKKKKEKVSDDFSIIPVKADLTARIGYRSMSVWGNYTLTRMFKSGKGPELHPYSLGVGFSF